MPGMNNKPILLFSIDQGFGNGVGAIGDLEIVSNMVNAISPLKEKYRVAVLLNPMLKDKVKLEGILDKLKSVQMPFVFDVYSSDSYTLGFNCPANDPYDPSHGQSISMEQLKAYKEKYRELLVGLRFMEIFGQDYTVRATKTTNPEWKRSNDKIPDDNFFRADLVEQYIKFCAENRMFLQWADFGWGEYAPWDKEVPEYEIVVGKLLKKYPGVVTVTYNNNEPEEASLGRLDTWQIAVQKFVDKGADGFGLSNQSWLRNHHHMETSPQEIIDWTKSAIDKGCSLIQFEPVWYFFNLPVGSFELNTAIDESQRADLGKAKESLLKLEAFLMNYQLKKNASGK